VPDAEPDPDRGYLTPAGALADGRQHAFAQAELMHAAQVVVRVTAVTPRGGPGGAR
jgi:hypothetical protein